MLISMITVKIRKTKYRPLVTKKARLSVVFSLFNSVRPNTDHIRCPDVLYRLKNRNYSSVMIDIGLRTLGLTNFSPTIQKIILLLCMLSSTKFS